MPPTLPLRAARLRPARIDSATDAMTASTCGSSLPAAWIGAIASAPSSLPPRLVTMRFEHAGCSAIEWSDSVTLTRRACDTRTAPRL